MNGEPGWRFGGRWLGPVLVVVGSLASPALGGPIVAHADGPIVAILSHTSWSETIGGVTQLHVVGQFQNDTSVNVSDVHAAYTLNVSSGQPGHSVVDATLRILAPGEVSPFEDVIPQPANYTGNSLVDGSAASWTPSISQSYNSLNAGQLSLTADACGAPSSAACQNIISGTVTNNASVVIADHVRVALTLFSGPSGSSPMVGQNVGTVLKADGTSVLMPGDSGTFILDRTGEPAWSGDPATGLLAVAEPAYPTDLNPSPLAFGNQRVGVSSPALPVALINKEDLPVTISSITTTGEFAPVQKCTTIPAHGACNVTVVYTPSIMGPETGSLTIANNAPGTDQTIALTGTGVAPLISLTPPSHDFGSVLDGNSSSPFNVTLANTGTALMTITGFAIGGANSGDFSADHSACPATLDLNASCLIAVTFSPTAPHGRNALLTVATDAFNTSTGVALSGTGIGPAISLDPSSWSFGNVNVGQQSAKPINLTNSGLAGNSTNGVLTVTAIGISGGFTEQDTCRPLPVSFQPGQGCVITVTFAPGSPGSASGDLTITDSLGTHTVHLTGVGVGPGVGLSTTSLSFGGETVGQPTTPQSVIVTNTGNVPLTISPIVASPSPVFFITANTCPSSLPATAGSNTCTVTVVFTPGAEGDIAGSLMITTSASSTAQTVTLTGTGLANWTSLSGILSSAPAASSWASNRMDVFVAGADRALWHRSFNSGIWGNWESLSGIITTKPAAVSWGANRIDVFVRGGDNGLWHKSSADGGAHWSDWENLSGKLNSAPTVSSMAPGELDVFALGGDNALWHRQFINSAWGPWESLGGFANAAPAAVSQGPGLIDVFVRGGDNGLWHKSFSNGSWTANWAPLSGILHSAPVATSWGVGRIDVFALGGDNALWHISTANGGTTWSNWSSQGGFANADPAAIARAVGVIDLFVRGGDFALWHKTITGS